MLINELTGFLNISTCELLLEHFITDSIFDGSVLPLTSKKVSGNSHDLLSSVKGKISSLIKVPLENFEDLCVARHCAGQKFKPHLDCFYIQPNSIFTKELFDKEMNEGGQRAFTCIIFLNDNYIGGEIFFDRVYTTITPAAGKLIYWKNTSDSGDVNIATEHGDMPILSGSKWTLSCYIREKKYTGDNKSGIL